MTSYGLSLKVHLKSLWLKKEETAVRLSTMYEHPTPQQILISQNVLVKSQKSTFVILLELPVPLPSG